MIIQRPDGREKTVVRNALRGGVVGLEVSLLATVLPNYDARSAFLIIVVSLGLGIAVAGLATLVGLLVLRPNKSTYAVEAKLEKGLAMLERGMIQEDDYHRIKNQVLEDYRPGAPDIRTVLRWAFKVGVVGATVPLLWDSLNEVLYGTGQFAIILGMTILGSGLAAGGSLATRFIQKLRQQPRLPATDRRMIDR